MSQLALSVEEGGVNKGIACLFFSRAGGVAQRERERALPVCSMESEMDANKENHLSAQLHCRGKPRQKQAVHRRFHVTTEMCLC